MNSIKHWNLKKLLVSVMLATLLALFGCDGDDGSDGASGPAGPAGPPGPAGNDGSSAVIGTLVPTQTMNSAITDASFTDGILSLNFTITDDKGYSYIDKTTLVKDLRFTIAQLQPADPTTGESTFWTRQAYEKVKDFPDNLVLNSDGTYTYTFTTSVTDFSNDEGITDNPAYTHRVAYQVGRGDLVVMNGSYDWQPSTGETENILTRNMVVEETCNNCHGKLEMHGAGKVDTAYCVTCHNPDLKDHEDTDFNDSADFKVMIHKVHRGANLPSVVAGGEYNFGENHDYSQTQLPQDIRNCSNCHDENNETTPDAANWINAPTMQACGSCHDNIDFTKGGEDPNGHPGGAVTDNAECALCHAQDRFASTFDAHMGLMNFKNSIREHIVVEAKAVRVTPLTGTVEADVMITVEGAPVTALVDDSGVDTEFGAIFGKYKYGPENGSLAINWDAGNGFETNHQEAALNSCVPDGAGLFTCTISELAPGIQATDMITVISVDLFVCYNEITKQIARCDKAADDFTRIAQVEVTPTQVTFNGDGTPSADAFDKVGADITACESCHADKIYHHGATELVQCKTCHNATRTGYRGLGDLKRHVHRFHSGLDKDELDITDPGNVAIDHFPNNIDNCQACHNETQFNLPLQQNTRASIAAGTSGDVFISPTAVVCSSCHINFKIGLIDPSLPGLTDPANGPISAKDQSVIDHMMQNGAVFGSSTFDAANKIESCAVCHAIGADYGVDKVHDIK